MGEYSLAIIFFGFAFIAWAVLFVNNALYLLRLRRLLALVEQRWPEKWKELGEPKLFTVFSYRQSVYRNSRTILKFLRNPGFVEDADIAIVLNQVRVHLKVGVIGFPIVMIAVLLGMFFLYRGMS